MSTSTSPYEAGLDKNAANYVPLTPIGFLVRSASVYPNRPAVVHGERRYSWREALERCRWRFRRAGSGGATPSP
jgi:fatty-acyl-CoA synthase